MVNLKDRVEKMLWANKDHYEEYNDRESFIAIETLETVLELIDDVAFDKEVESKNG